MTRGAAHNRGGLDAILRPKKKFLVRYIRMIETRVNSYGIWKALEL